MHSKHVHIIHGNTCNPRQCMQHTIYVNTYNPCNPCQYMQYTLIPVIHTNTGHTCKYIHSTNTHQYTSIWLSEYKQIHAIFEKCLNTYKYIPIHTYKYIPIHTDTCKYMWIHTCRLILNTTTIQHTNTNNLNVNSSYTRHVLGMYLASNTNPEMQYIPTWTGKIQTQKCNTCKHEQEKPLMIFQ